MKQIICMKWGSLYGSDYVNKLYNMCEKNISYPFRFVCLTDDCSDLKKEIETFSCPEVKIPSPKNNYGWRKISLFSSSNNLFGLTGTWLYLDLDTVIVRPIDDFFSYKSQKSFVVMKNWNQPKKMIGNTSVYRFDIGANEYLLNDLEDSYNEILEKYSNSQTYISYNIKEITFWPDHWCSLFKIHCVHKWPLNYFLEPKLPKKTRVIAFPGVPNPHDAIIGKWPDRYPNKKWKKLYKYIRPAKWITNYWN